MYVQPNFKTKKALKEALARGEEVRVYSVSMFPESIPRDGKVSLEGPHYPQPHRWYATGTMKDGKLVKIR